MHVQQSRIKLIKTEFESKLLFENPLINDASFRDLPDEFSSRIIELFNELPQDKSFVSEIEFEDAVIFWWKNGEVCHSKLCNIVEDLKGEILIGLAMMESEFGKPHYLSDYIFEEKKFDILIIKEKDGAFGILKESLSHGVLVQLANLTSRVQELERKRLSLDLHDSVTQHLSGIKFLLSALRNESDKGKSIIAKCEKAIDSALNETRMVSRNLMPLKLEDKGFDGVLNELCKRLEQHYKVQLMVTGSSVFSEFHSNFQLAVFRIIQELCSNSIKHGKSTDMKVDFTLGKEEMTISYEDNGKGFDIENYNKTRMGMSNIYYRIFQFGGELAIKSGEKKGVNYNFTFPISKIEKV